MARDLGLTQANLEQFKGVISREVGRQGRELERQGRQLDAVQRDIDEFKRWKPDEVSMRLGVAGFE